MKAMQQRMAVEWDETSVANVPVSSASPMEDLDPTRWPRRIVPRKEEIRWWTLAFGGQRGTEPWNWGVRAYLEVSRRL
jgi:hypothetical protein